MDITENLKTANKKVNYLSTDLEYLRKQPIVELILTFIENETGFSYIEINVKTRKRPLTEARQLVMYLLKLNSKYSLARVASLFGRDHATALHANKTIKNLSETDKRIKGIVEKGNLAIQKWKDLQKVKKYLEAENKEDETKLDVFNELLGKFILTKYNKEEQNSDDWLIRYIDAK